jgi:hypothetical protein
MTSVPRQLTIFAAVLAVLYAAGFAAGHIIGADPPGGHGEAEAAHGGGGGGHEQESVAHGLSGTENGLRLAVDARTITPGRSQDIAFSVLDERGAPVTAYDTTHTKRMHLILVRRDLTGFQHLHPSQDEAGVWHARTTIEQPGSHRLFADFSPRGTKTTLAGDVRVDGRADDEPLPAAEPRATTEDGYEVRIDAGNASAGEESTLAFSVVEDGREVATEPYLGAGGHLVALREGDLAFLHVHPTERPGTIAFDATFPSAGRYRLFLQFKVDGAVQTAAFTHEVG